MRRVRAALLAVVPLLALLSSETSARASALVLELGLRAGYVFGRGWTLGTVASFARAGFPSNWFLHNDTVALGGLAASVDVVLPAAAALDRVEWRFHAGPELSALHACRAAGGVVYVGALWSLRQGEPIRLGIEGGGTVIGALYVPRSGGGPLFGGLAYRYGQLIGVEGAHEVALDFRGWTLPFETGLGNWAPFCSVFSTSRGAFAD
jgi:hypothetical protein